MLLFSTPYFVSALPVSRSKYSFQNTKLPPCPHDIPSIKQPVSHISETLVSIVMYMRGEKYLRVVRVRLFLFRIYKIWFTVYEIRYVGLESGVEIR